MIDVIQFFKDEEFLSSKLPLQLSIEYSLNFMTCQQAKINTLYEGENAIEDLSMDNGQKIILLSTEFKFDNGVTAKHVLRIQ